MKRKMLIITFLLALPLMTAWATPAMSDAIQGCESTCTGYGGAGGCCSCFCGGFFNYCYFYCISNAPQ
jgi:hypothetical protein